MLRSLIVARARNGTIGKDNGMPWHLPADLAHFKRTTLGRPVIMGRRTWESIGRALPGRRNIVVSRTPGFEAPGAEVVASLADAWRAVAGEEEAFVIGGAQIYVQALPLAEELALTEIDADFDGDVFFPEWDRAQYEQTSREDHSTPQGLHYSFTHYNKTRGN